jgi:hypothetical protein
VNKNKELQTSILHKMIPLYFMLMKMGYTTSTNSNHKDSNLPSLHLKRPLIVCILLVISLPLVGGIKTCISGISKRENKSSRSAMVIIATNH